MNKNQTTSGIPKKSLNDIRRRFDDHIEIAKEFEPPISDELTKNIDEKDEKELLHHYKKRKTKN